MNQKRGVLDKRYFSKDDSNVINSANEKEIIILFILCVFLLTQLMFNMPSHISYCFCVCLKVKKKKLSSTSMIKVTEREIKSDAIILFMIKLKKTI